MNLRCIYCQTPFTLSRSEMLSAIVTMNERHQSHYDAHCPRCRRANSISRQRMELFFPNWQAAAKQQAAAPVEPVHAAPPPAPKAETPASAFLKTEPLPKAMKAALEKKAEAKPAAKKTTAKPAVKKPAAKKPAAAKEKPVAKKPAAKKPAATKKK
ncbi:MAG: hypothetical protein PHQ36_02230 [Anaerolineales bacterium]|nr:hypothetical protein [Anaerolineales bacterium]